MNGASVMAGYHSASGGQTGVGDAGAGSCDVAIAGAGLAGAMLALRLNACRPDARVQAFDRAAMVGSGRTWSFFASDPTPAQATWLDAFVAHRWDSYEVRFPRLHRIMRTGYRTLSRTALDHAMTGLHRNVVLADVARDGVTVAGRDAMPAGLVLDARGARPPQSIRLGYQKFVGQYLELERPHGVLRPVLMDACVEQTDGFRFVYILPLSPTRLLVEDTRYTDDAALDRASFLDGIAEYCAARDWRAVSVLEEEDGVLPVVLSGNFDDYWAEILRAGPAVPIGTRAGFFHHTTSYSVPFAIAMADSIAASVPIGADDALRLVHQAAARLWRAQSFYRLLNRMLFLACAPDERWRVFQRFYSLPEPLINRFYAARSTAADKLRIVSGRPPISIFRALAVVPVRRA